MNKGNLRKIIYFMIVILISILAIKFIFWVFPIILIIVLAYIIYNQIIRSKENKKANQKVITDDKYKKR